VSAGWVTYNSGGMKYITVAPSATTKAYSVINPFNVSAAADKKMYFCTSYNLNGSLAADASLTVQVSTDYEGSIFDATWQTIQTISLPAENTWSIQTVDLGAAYAAQSRVFVAFCYEGKGVRFNVSGVAFGQSLPALFYPIVSVPQKSLKFGDNTADKAAEIVVPYSFGGGIPTAGLMTCNNPALTITPTEANLNGVFQVPANFTASGVIADFTPVTFTVNATSPVSSILPVTDGNMPTTFNYTDRNGSSVPYDKPVRTDNPSLVSLVYERDGANNELKYVTSGGTGTDIFVPVVFESNGKKLFSVEVYTGNPLTATPNRTKAWTAEGLVILPNTTNAQSGSWIYEPRSNGIIYTIPVRELPLWGDIRAILTFGGATNNQNPSGTWYVDYSLNGGSWRPVEEGAPINMGVQTANHTNGDVVLDVKFTIPQVNAIPPSENALKFWVYKTPAATALTAIGYVLKIDRPISVTYSQPTM